MSSTVESARDIRPFHVDVPQEELDETVAHYAGMLVKGGPEALAITKRLVRELFRHNKPSSFMDVVVVPRREILSVPYDRLETEFKSLLSRRPSTRTRHGSSGESSPTVGPR